MDLQTSAVSIKSILEVALLLAALTTIITFLLKPFSKIHNRINDIENSLPTMINRDEAVKLIDEKINSFCKEIFMRFNVFELELKGTKDLLTEKIDTLSKTFNSIVKITIKENFNGNRN